MTKTELRALVLQGVYSQPQDDFDSLFLDAAKATGMNDPSVPQAAREFVENQARMHGSEDSNLMLGTFVNYCDFAEEILKIVNAVHAFYDL